MSRDDVIQSVAFGEIQQLIKLHIAVTVDTRVGSTACFISAYELSENTVLEVKGEIKHLIGNIQLKCDFGGVINIPLRTTGMKVT